MPYAYKRIRLGRGITRDRHRLLMEAKLGRKLTFNEIVHHKNEIKSDDSEENLEVISRSVHASLHLTGKPGNKLSENQKHLISMRHRGELNQSAKLTERAVLEIRDRYSNGTSCAELAEIYDVSRATITRVVAHKLWKHVT